MSVIAGRHVRWDWQTFVEWPQKSARTLCGMTSQARLCGIPGITEQPQIVGDKFGWCLRCIDKFAVAARQVTFLEVPVADNVRELYYSAMRETDKHWLYLQNPSGKRYNQNVTGTLA